MTDLTVADVVLAATTPAIMEKMQQGWAIRRITRHGCEMVPYTNDVSERRIPVVRFTPDCEKDLTR